MNSGKQNNRRWENASCHSSLLNEYLFKNTTFIITEPPYSPDLALIEFFNFRNK